MHIGSLKKRMIKLSKRLHRSIDGSAQGAKLEGLVNDFEATVNDAHKAIGDGRGKADKALSKAVNVVDKAVVAPKIKALKKK
tara:strand:- start:24 stop:269 length:246 start_codon:yes stop_codon:yes gene_type:complete